MIKTIRRTGLMVGTALTQRMEQWIKIRVIAMKAQLLVIQVMKLDHQRTLLIKGLLYQLHLLLQLHRNLHPKLMSPNVIRPDRVDLKLRILISYLRQNVYVVDFSRNYTCK
jgi:hypothetical protein